jgi:hypothetical protein
MSCPVVVAIGEIKGGFVGYGDESADDNIADGETGPQILEDAVFNLMKRKLTLARFELKKPNRLEVETFFDRYFRPLAGISYRMLYISNIGDLNVPLLESAFTTTFDAIVNAEAVIVIRLMKKPIAVSIPTVSPVYMINYADPAALHAEVQKYTKYINEIRAGDWRPTPVAPLAEFQHMADLPLSGAKAERRLPPAEGDLLVAAHGIMQAEEEVAAIVQKVEKYWCACIGKLNEVKKSCLEAALALK